MAWVSIIYPTRHRKSEDLGAVLIEEHLPHPTPRIFVDITAAHAGLVGGGIKRVCLKIGEALNRSAEAQPCVTQNGRLFALKENQTIGEPLSIQTADTYIILDSFWEPFSDYKNNLVKARETGARTAVCIHDVIPILRPRLIVDDWAEWFRECYIELLPHIDILISVSRASAAEVERATKLLCFDKPVTWFHLGSDTFRPLRAPQHMSKLAFASVGTLEPKKGYEITLDAFDIVWSTGADVSYTILGSKGWLCSALINRIEQHSEYNKRLFWLDLASDAEVAEVLDTTYCYIQASLAEGFGLPLVEAGSRGLPIIASDLAVFREICIEDVVFFPACDSNALARAILDAAKTRPKPAKTIALSWDQSAAALIQALKNESSSVFVPDLAD